MKTKLGFRIWFNALFFGLIGQIAWIVENMYFATFAQDVFKNAGRSDLSYLITTLMVIFSAIAATVTTIFAGSVTDRVGKRKPFIAFGYILWGLTIMLFALIPINPVGKAVALSGALLVVFDCIMTFAGSTSNDAAFNAWVIDNTDKTNRGLVDSILSILPLIAVVIVFIGLSGIYQSSSKMFFIVIGIIPIVSGLIAIFTFKDSKDIKKNDGNYLENTFYGFKKQVIKDNKMMYITLTFLSLVGIAQQTFFSYLINFLQYTLGLDIVMPMAVIIVGAGIVTGIMGALYDKFGRKHFFIPLLVITIIGITSFYLIQFMNGALFNITLYLGGILMMGGILSLTGILTASFQDYTPKGYEGRFQGVRMTFVVLIPMIIGPIISLIIGLDAMGMNGDNFTPPYTIFLASAVVAILAFIPLIFVRRDADRLRNEKKED